MVAKGAALHAASLLGEVDAPMLFDVTPFNLGIDVQAGLFQTLIAKNARIPVSAAETFVLQPGKRSVTIVVRQGLSRFSADNEFLGEFRVSNLELRNDGVAEIDISFRLDGNGMLHVSAKDVVSGRTVEMKMRNYGEFIREEDDFEQSSGQEKAQIGIGDSSASGGRGLDVQIQHRQEAPTIDDKTREQARRMREVMAITDIESEEESSEEEAPAIINLNAAMTDADAGDDEGEGWSDEDAPSVQITLGGVNFDNLTSFVEELSDETAVTVQDEQQGEPQVAITLETDSEESEEAFVLTLDTAEDDDDSEEVFVLGETSTVVETVEPADLNEANDALSQLLHSGFDNDILLPQDDFFAGLTAAVTGQSIQDILNEMTIAELEEDAEGELSKLSPEMRMVLEELFAEI